MPLLTQPRRASRSRLREEHGHTLVEYVVGLAIGISVLGAVLTFFDTTQRQVGRHTEWAHSITDARAGVYRMTRELRQATRVHPTASGDDAANRIAVDVHIGGSDVRVEYRCDEVGPESDLHRCVRSAANQTGETVVVARLLNGTSKAPDQTVFDFSPDGQNPTYVTVTAVVPSAGQRADGFEHQMVLRDGIYLRNLGTQ